MSRNRIHRIVVRTIWLAWHWAKRWTTRRSYPLDPATPEYWGAKADGATDDTAAIQAAFDYVSRKEGAS